MKQRLGVAAALLKDPRLVVLDEPTNGLDPAGMADMRALVRRLGAAGCTVLLSSHLMTEVQELCDRVGVISGGRLVAESTVAELRGERTLRVVAAPLDAAASIVASRWGADAVRVAEGGLDLAVAPEQAAAVNAELVAAGVAVSELTTRERSLEQAFFELTREEDHPCLTTSAPRRQDRAPAGGLDAAGRRTRAQPDLHLPGAVRGVRRRHRRSDRRPGSRRAAARPTGRQLGRRSAGVRSAR